MIESLPILAVALPLLGAFTTPIIDIISSRVGKPKANGVFSLFILILTSLAVVGMISEVRGGGVIFYSLAGRMSPWGINLAIDGLNLMVAIIVAGISTLIVIYSLSFMEGKTGLGKYYTLLLLLTAGMMGVTLTGDIFNLYVFFEIMSIASYALVAFYRTEGSVEGAFKYLVIGTIGTASILLGVSMVYGLAGSLNIADLAVRLNSVAFAAGNPPFLMSLALGLFVVGFGIKIAMVPLHAWLPDAYQSAPSSITSVLAGGTAVVGVYALLRISYFLFGELAIGPLFIILGLVTMIVGALMALMQNDLKRLLAYSGISQMGYILLGVGMGTAYGIEGGLFHMLNNAIYKPLLFMCAGAVVLRVGTSNMDELGGLGEKMPFTAFVFGIGTLAIAGIPPFNGFASKWAIYVAGIEYGQPILTIIALIISALTLAYLLKAFSSIFLGQRPKNCDDVKEIPMSMLIPMFVLAALCIALGIFPDLGFEIAGTAKNGLFEQVEYVQAVLGGV